MLTTNQFRTAVEVYLQAKGMSAKAFGVATVNDPNFVSDLRGGRSVGLKLIEKVAAYMDVNPPMEAEREDA